MAFGRSTNMSRRPVRPDGGFHRDKRRKRLGRRSLLETGKPPAATLFQKLTTALARALGR